jgi:xanthine dehydrogenase YagR molybdenum-binding subunit
MSTTAHIGKPTSRVDGRLKVTGGAKYAGEHDAPGLAYGFVVSSTIAKGKITKVNAAEAMKVAGVLKVFMHENAPELARSDKAWRDEVAPPGSPFRPLQDNEVRYSGQPIALVVAETFEAARYAATLVRVEYEKEPHATELHQKLGEAYKPKERDGVTLAAKPRGDADKAFEAAAVKIDGEYDVPVEHHNPMEPFASTVIVGSDGKFTVWEKTQGVQNVHDYLCNVFDLPKDDVRVLCPFMGGGFGSGLRPQYQVFLAMLAAKELKRSVRVTLTRQQMFTFGHRPTTHMRVRLGAKSDGTLEAIIPEAVAETSQFEDYSEAVVTWSGLLYRCENVRMDHKVTKLDFYTPCDMRAPGAVWGLYAIETAMDELAVALKMDPLELRLKNYSDKDYNEDKPYSSKELRAAYQQAAEKFGWSKRNPQPRSMRDGDWLVGHGMATGVWESMQQEAEAKATLGADGSLLVTSATEDIGTGTYTVMTQIAADLLGLPLEKTTFKLGDSSFPKAPVEGGSFTVATVGSAIHDACMTLRAKLLKLAKKMDASPLANAKIEEVSFADGQMRLNSDASRAVSIADVMRATKTDTLDAEAQAAPGSKRKKFATYAHSAIFAEVKVDQDLGTIRVTRLINATAGGRIINPKTAGSQILGGLVWGIGSALLEESVIDQTFGRFMNHNLAEYHVPVNADVHDVQVMFVDEKDEVVNPLGAKGLGEIGVVGVAAAIGNAIYNATGKRIRKLPITLDKLL